MRDFFECLFVLVLGFFMVYAYVQIICDGVWLCAFDSSPRTCSMIYKRR